MNRRQRRANGQYGRGQHLAHAIRCPDCDSEVTVTRVTHRIYNGEVRHDETYPWYRALKRAGGLAIRFGHTEDQPEGQE